MNWQTLPYLIPYLFSVIISTGVGVYAWRRRAVAGAAPFAMVALAQASSTLCYIFELVSPSLEAKILWDNIQFVEWIVWMIAFLAFAFQYVGHKLPHPKRTWGLLTIVPIISSLLMFTDDLHGWIRPAAWLVPGEPFSALMYDITVPVWITILYLYGLFLSGILVLIIHFTRSRRLYRAQVGTVLIGALIPLVGTVLTLMEITLTFHRDTTPFTFAIGNLVVAWGLFRYRLFDVVPVARNAVIEGMSDIVVVLDAQSRVVDLNPAAQTVIGQAASEVIGQPSAQVFSNWPDLVEQYQDVEVAHTEIMVGGEEQRHFDLRLSPLRDQRGRLVGRLIIARD
ncbi:histidine kinase N-terminal 7TM domain-containing protein, partial [Chloroflexota bacterium]